MERLEPVSSVHFSVQCVPLSVRGVQVGVLGVQILEHSRYNKERQQPKIDFHNLWERMRYFIFFSKIFISKNKSIFMQF